MRTRRIERSIRNPTPCRGNVVAPTLSDAEPFATIVSCQTIDVAGGAVAFGPSGLLANMTLPRVHNRGELAAHEREACEDHLIVFDDQIRVHRSPPPSDPPAAARRQSMCRRHPTRRRNRTGPAGSAVFPLNESLIVVRPGEQQFGFIGVDSDGRLVVWCNRIVAADVFVIDAATRFAECPHSLNHVPAVRGQRHEPGSVGTIWLKRRASRWSRPA